MSYPTLTNLINAIRIANEATSLSQAIINSGPEWFWRLDETSGTIALDEMGNKNLTYESDASTADYSIAASGDKIDGYSKDINADSALQIFEAGGAPAPTYCQQQDPQDYVARWELENIVTGDAAPNDMYAHWALDDASGDIADLVGSKDLTASAVVAYSKTGAVGTAIQFNNSTSVRRIGNNSDFDSATFTCSIWIKSSSLASTSATTAQVFSRYSVGAHEGFAIDVAKATGLLRCVVGNSSTSIATGTAIDVVTGDWHHVAISYDGDKVTIYHNGAQVGQSISVAIVHCTSAIAMRLGNNDYNTLYQWNGDLDDAKYFKRALSGTEISNLYEADLKLPTDFVAEWKLDSDGSDTNGNHDATPVGTPTYVTGFVDNACSLNGTDQYYTVTDHADLRPTNITVCAWVKTSYTAGAGSIFSHFEHIADKFSGYNLRTSPEGLPFFAVYSDTGLVSGTDHDNAGSTTVVTDGKWHHLAGTYDGTNIKFYLDGVLEETVSYAGGIAYAPSATYPRIGCRTADNGTGIFFNGRIDGVKLFDYAATADQVAALSRIAVSSTYAEHSGLIHGSPISTVDNGQIGQAMTFDGVNDYIAIPDSAALKPTNVSVSAWVKTSATDGRVLVSWHNPTPVAGYDFSINGGNVQLLLGDNTGDLTPGDWDYISGTTALDDGEWHHIVGTYDGSDIKVYADGVLEGTKTWAVGIGYNASNVIALGARFDTGAWQQFFDGTIDDVRVYDRAITLDEVTAMYGSRVVAPPEDFVAEWLMDNPDVEPTDEGNHYTFESVNSSTIFGSANSRDINITNGPGEYGTGLNGGTSLTRTPSGSSKGYNYSHGLGFLGSSLENFTISFWFKFNSATLDTQDGSGYGCLLEFGFSGFQGILIEYYVPSEYFRTLVGNGSALISIGATSIDEIDTGWHHYCLRVEANGSDGIGKIWIDGKSLGYQYDIPSNVIFDGLNAYLLARNSSNNFGITGAEMDDLRIFEYALTEDQILSLQGVGALKETTLNHSAELIASPTFTTGWENNALTLNGSTQYATVVDDVELHPTVFSVSAWIKCTSSGDNQRIYAVFYENTGVSYAGFSVYLRNSTSTPGFAIYNGTNLDTSYCGNATTEVMDGDWHHVCFVFDGTDQKIYVDGVLDGDVTATETLGYGSVGSHDIHIGNMPSPEDYFNGSIDSLKVYDRAITLAEVQALANYGLCTAESSSLNPPTDYIAHWNMDDASVSGSTMLDSTANNHDATMVDTPTTGEAGKLDEAVLFNGSSELMTVVNHVNFRPSAFSVTAWVKGSGYIFQSASAASNRAGFWLSTSGVYIAKNTGWVADTDSKTLTSGARDSTVFEHYTFTYDGTTMSYYRNGVLVGETDFTGLAFETTNYVRIGCKNETGTDYNFFTGTIDSLKVFNRAITAQEVEDMYLDDGGVIADPTDYVARWELENIVTGSNSPATPVDYIARWSCDDDRFTAGQLQDSSANNFDMILNNFPDTDAVAGAQKQAVRFLAASSTYCDRSRNAAFEVSNISLSFWIKQNSAATGYVWQYGQSYSGDTNHSGHEVYITSAYNVGVYVYTGSGQSNGVTATSDAPLTDGLFHHVVITYDGTTANIYIDGVLNTSTTLSVALGYDITNTKHIIGCESYAGSSHRNYLDADIDELLFYDRVLSLTEAAELYATEGIIAEWKLDSDGIDTYENHNAVPVNSPTYATGFVGNACVLNGSDQYYTVTDHADLKPTNITVCGWIRTELSGAVGIIAQNQLLHTGATLASGWYAQITSSGKLNFYIANNTTASYVGSSTSVLPVNDNQWHHFCGTYDGTDIKMYIDGALTSESAVASGLAYEAATHYCQIGAFNQVGVVNSYFNGRIDELKLFNYAATADQVAALSRIAPSSTYNAYTGLVYGSPISTVDNGQIGQAMTFDGVNDYIEIPDSVALKPANVSVSAWVKYDTATGTPQSILQSWETNTNHAGFLVLLSNTYCIQLTVADDTGNLIDVNYKLAAGSTPLVIDTWHHVVATYDGATLKVYRDGVLDGSAAWTNGIIYDSANMVRIGVREDTAAGKIRYFSGTIDDVRVYDYAITQGQISQIYTSRVVAPPTDFVAEWLMDDNIGNVAVPTDYISKYEFTNASGTDLTTDANLTNVGVGSIADRNANSNAAASIVPNDYYHCANDAHFQSATSFTFSTWIYQNGVGSGLNSGVFNCSYQWFGGATEGWVVVSGQNKSGLWMGDASSGASYTNITTGVPYQEWYHMGWTYDGTYIKGYINGVLRYTWEPSFTMAHGSTPQVVVGATKSGGVTYGAFNDIRLDDMTIFDRAISSDEMAVLAESTNLYETTDTHHGTLVASPTFTTGWENNALTLNGSTQYATVVDATAIKPNYSDFSISGWVNNSSTVTREVVISKKDMSEQSGYEVYFNNGVLYGEIFGGGSNGSVVIAALGNANDGSWHHFVFASDDSVNLYGYLDGVLSNTTPLTDGIWGGSYQVAIGRESNATTGYFNGSIDALKFYDRVITLAEVQALAQYESTTIEATTFSAGDISPSQDFTIECAFKIDTSTASMMLMGRMSDTVNWGIRLTSGDSNILELVLTESDTTDRTTTICSSLSAAGVTSDGVWHWMSIRMDRATNELLSTVIDGTEVTSIDVSGWGTVWLNSDTTQFTIGDTAEAGSNAWNGGVDEVAIYQKAVTDQERNRNYSLWGNSNTAFTTATTSVLPVSVTDTVASGAYTTPLLSATAINGRGPFSFLWTSDGSKLTPDNPTDAETTFSGNEEDTSTTETLTCTITDHGDGDATSNDTTTTNITWLVASHTVTITPSDLVTTVPAGAYTSEALTTTVLGGVGPFTYLWSSDGSNLTPDSPTSPTTTFSGSEINVHTFEHIKCVVTDTGNSNAESEDEIHTSVRWEANSLTVQVTPNPMTTVVVSNGAYTTPLLTATPTGGVGPFEYLWTSTVPELTPDTPTASTTTFSGTESELQVSGELFTCTITDTGDPFNLQAEDTADGDIQWSAINDFIAHWTYDDITGMVVADETANNHDCTMENTPVVVDGYDLKAIYFDESTDQYGTIADHADFKSAAFTFATWIKAPNSGDHVLTIFQSYDETANIAGWRIQKQWYLGLGSYSIVLGANTGTTYITDFISTSTSAVSADNEWEHLVVTYDGLTLIAYINGVEVENFEYAPGVGYAAGNKVRLGVYESALEPKYPMDGYLDETKVYDTALSASAVDLLYNQIPSFAMNIAPTVIDTRVSPDEWYISPQISAFALGGTGPYTYVWSHESGTTLAISGSTTGSSITVEGTASSGTTIDTFKCIITDTSDGSFIEDTITVTVLWELSFKEQFYLDNGFHFDDVR